MNFIQAVKLLETGIRARRTQWVPGEFIALSTRYHIQIYLPEHSSTKPACLYVPTFKDITAEDWTVFN